MKIKRKKNSSFVSQMWLLKKITCLTFFFASTCLCVYAEVPPCNKIAVVFETKYKNNRVLVYADDSLYFDRKITNKNIKVIEVADAVEINKRPKTIVVKVGNKRKMIEIDPSDCYIYVRHKGLFGKLILEKTSTQRKYR